MTITGTGFAKTTSVGYGFYTMGAPGGYITEEGAGSTQSYAQMPWAVKGAFTDFTVVTYSGSNFPVIITPLIEGALVTVDQYRVESYGPAWPWPFGSKTSTRPIDAARKLVVWGKDLPKRGEPAVFEKLTPGITGYWLDMAVGEAGSDAAKNDVLNQAWKRVQQVALASGQTVDRS